MDDVDDSPVQGLSPEQAWDFLRRHELGRLAHRLGEDLTIVPVNYSVAGQRLLIRTAQGSKLLGVVMHPRVAFEVDEIGATSATSVIARGTATQLSEREVTDTEALQPRPWIDTPKYEVIAIDLHEISGRTFVVDRRP